MVQVIFFVLLIASVFVSPAIALFAGIIFALSFKAPHPKFSKKTSKYLLQISVVGLGFGMNLHESLQSSEKGMVMTIVSVMGVLALGMLLGRWLKIEKKLSYLVASGTAICGGSAIAAVSPVVKANENETSMALAVIFTLNAIALFIFPPIGRFLELDQQQFGMWAAIAIHDTSSVVGAGAAYGPEALTVATTVKLTRALWIIPLAFVSILFFPQKQGGKTKVQIPWFILIFVLAMIFNTYVEIPTLISKSIKDLSHSMLSATLFLIGTGLSVQAIKEVGAKPIILGVLLWVIISFFALGVVML